MKMQYHGPSTDKLECGGVYDPADFPGVDPECWSTPSFVEPVLVPQPVIHPAPEPIPEPVSVPEPVIPQPSEPELAPASDVSVPDPL